MDRLEKIKQSTEQELSGRESYKFLKKQKNQKRSGVSEIPKKIGKYSLYAVIVVIVMGGFGWFVATRPNLPPTNMQGHIESSPIAHIIGEPMPENIQRHMLEHADGKDKPAVIIQYNCRKYACEPDLVQKLADLVKRYPNNVYLAPNDYNGKIILSKLGELKILDGFDERVIKKFIGG